MNWSGRTKFGVTVAVSVIAGLVSVFVSVVLLAFAAFYIAWGEAPERTETFVKGLPFGDSVLRALSNLHLLLADRS
ncbi:MAG TPA: hypothetical protein VEK34_05115 [Methylocella sp.]|nr:hypothetical protein [Methylocella sp.]